MLFDDMQVELAQAALGGAVSVAVLTGAGISTDSGIPDFRGPNGVWTRNPKAERTSTLRHYLEDPDVREVAWQTRVHSPAWDAVPNAGHHALVRLEQQGRLHTLVTQNIDELHRRAGNSPEKIVEIHGTMRRAVCWSCGVEGPMEPFLERVRAGERDPHCPQCGGVVKSATISFGQNLVEADLERAFHAAESAEVLLAVGSSLAVFPVARMIPVALRSGAKVVIVNGEPTQFDDDATAVVRGSIGDVLPGLIA